VNDVVSIYLMNIDFSELVWFRVDMTDNNFFVVIRIADTVAKQLLVILSTLLLITIHHIKKYIYIYTYITYIHIK
jgi:hypothetical protein